ncbi:Zinc transport protein ZntB [Marinomonas gallaica]|uniref:Zinc transport protein ZntB n=2 Tax=Marinomonas gallaica TaxID=1806667 RepID=A0A1C3JNX1_9GAMM|nr:zinc transporter ZntB [Marinomonas gallaica]SBT16908.1 Zinc transport protein ZntB [Marinomonas gallaica]SBT22141.1 Zinc transport protein ZntB [Marinomonas gallaica]
MGYLLHYLKFDGQGGAERLTDLPNEVPQSGAHWVHIDCSQDGGREWMDGIESIPDAVVDALFADETRPRTVKMGNGVLMTLRGVNLNPDSDPSDMVSLRLWVTPHLVISTRRRRLLSVMEQVSQLEQGIGAENIADLIATLTHTLTIRMAGVIDGIEDTLGDLEEDMAEEVLPEQRSILVERRLKTVRLRRFLVPQKEAIARLAVEVLPWMTKEQVAKIQEASNEITRYVEGLESLRERCLLMQEEFANHQAEKMNARMYVLSILSGIFMPLGFLTGLFGINIGGMPGVENSAAFWLFVGVLVFMGIGQFVLMRKSRWF